MTFPVSDHCDGLRFFNPGSSPDSRRGRSLLRWRREHRPAPWPARIIDPPFPAPPASVPAGHAAVTFIGHASFLIRLPGITLLTDPMFSERCSPVGWAGPRRARAPGLTLAALPPIDLILISHNHYDHLDLPSLRALRARHAPHVVTLLGNAAVLRHAGYINQVEELDWWQTATIAGVRVTATPARHFSSRTPFDRGRALWGGGMIEAADGGRLLFAGDSGAGPHWADIRDRLGAPGLALLPIGAYEPRWFMAPVHMNPEEAVAAHLALGARQSIGMHFGTFQLTDEAIDAPTAALTAACAAAAVDSFDVLGVGETRVVPLG